MWKVAKYKILDITENRMIEVLVVLFFIILNVSIFSSRQDLTYGAREFNQAAKYLLLMDKVTSLSTILGLIISIFIGASFIGDDINSSKLHIMIVSFPKRWMYFFGCFLGVFIVMITLIVLTIINYCVVAIVLKIKINYGDLLYCFSQIFLDYMIIIVTTSVASIFLNETGGIIVGFIQLIIYNVYTFGIVPFINIGINLNMTPRKILACFAPLNSMSFSSIYGDGSIARETFFTPYIIDNMNIYQIAFIIVVLLIGGVLFKKKQL